MNLSDARIVLRPRSLAETFDLGLRWCAGVGGALYLRLALLVLFPPALGCYLLGALGEVPWPIVWVVAVVVVAPLQGVFTIAASRLMFEPAVTARQVLVHYIGRLPAYVGALFIAALFNMLGVVMVVALPWTWARVGFVHEAALLEGQGSTAAVRRSGAFVSRQYGAVILMLGGMLIAAAVTIAAADQVGAALFEFVLQLGRPLGSLWDDGGSLGALLGFFGITPYLASVRFLTYIDGRTRRDGWDVQLAFMAIALRAEQERGQEPASQRSGAA